MQHSANGVTGKSSGGESSSGAGPKSHRASKACSRCRRYRTKCIPGPTLGEAPCQQCLQLGITDQWSVPRSLHGHPACVYVIADDTSVYMPRGHSYADRNVRPHPRFRPPTRPLAADDQHRRRPGPGPSISSSPSTSINGRSQSTSAALDPLPPPQEITEAVDNYVSSYFQVGFIHKPLFLDRYRQDPRSVSVLLLLAICSVAAPFSPSLSARYGGKGKAIGHFLEQANGIAAGEMLVPTLARTQACESIRRPRSPILYGCGRDID
jgi:hypothetical protein